MLISRRLLMGGTIAVTATVWAATALSGVADLPAIWGDGVHDDADGLEAMLTGRPFTIAGSGPIVAAAGEIGGGRFRVSRTVRVTGGAWTIHDCAFLAHGGFVGSALLELAAPATIRGVTFDHQRHARPKGWATVRISAPERQAAA